MDTSHQVSVQQKKEEEKILFNCTNVKTCKNNESYLFLDFLKIN